MADKELFAVQTNMARRFNFLNRIYTHFFGHTPLKQGLYTGSLTGVTLLLVDKEFIRPNRFRSLNNYGWAAFAAVTLCALKAWYNVYDANYYVKSTEKKEGGHFEEIKEDM